MVFLVGRGRDRIDAGGIGALLVLGDQRRRRHLRDHEARIETRPRRQERRQARQGRIDQHGDAALGQRADLAQRQCDDVGSKSDRLGVEVAARQRLVGIGEDQRIVGDAVGFCFERRRRLTKDVEHRAHDLRLAAQAVGILYPLVAHEMRGTDCRSGHQAAQRVCCSDLAAVATQLVDARIEWRVRAARRVGRERAGHQRRAMQVLGFEQASQRIGGRKLRAVQQGEPFLGAQHKGLQPRIAQRLCGRHGLAVDDEVTDANHRRAHMGERRQVPGGADRALARDDRSEASGQQRLQQLHGGELHAGGALRQAAELQRHHEAHDGNRHRRANAGSVAQHDVALEGFQVGLFDADAGQLPEAGVDAVDGLVPGEDR